MFVSLYPEQTMHNCCALSQTSSSAPISPATLNNGFAVATADIQQLCGKIRQTVAVQYLTRWVNSLTTCAQFRKTILREDLLLSETKNKKSF